jgi:hypothetical protein
MKYAVHIFKKYQLADYEQAAIHFEEVKLGRIHRADNLQ